MEIDVTFTARDLAIRPKEGRVVVIIDVVRASTTISQGIASGCTEFIPVQTVSEARRRAGEVPVGRRLLGGERGGLRPQGFDLGNSPLDYSADRVAGKTIVFTTTNGTMAIKAALGAKEVVVGALVNLETVADYLLAVGRDVTLAGAGRESRPVLDDALCAGAIAQRVLEKAQAKASPTDSALMAIHLARGYHARFREALALSASGMALKGVGLDRDLDFCAQVDALSVLPRLVDGRITG